MERLIVIAYLKWLFNGKCKHLRVRCIHGDEIILAGYRRSRCLDCPSLFDSLPTYCSVTGEKHPSYEGESKVAMSKLFNLQRDEDETGISGTGIVANGVVFPDGSVAMRWATDVASTAVYASIEDVEHIHGHGGKTRVIFTN